MTTKLYTKEGRSYISANGLTSAPLYIMPISATPTISENDTMATHAGWTEVTAYSQATRQVWTPGTTVNGATDNSASPAVFAFAGATATGGFALVTSSTKGGTTGTLVAVFQYDDGLNRTIAAADEIVDVAALALENVA